MKKRLALALILFPFIARALPPLAKERVVLQTDFGPIVLALYEETAPKTVKQFLKMVRLGIYDTTHFFRVHPGFVAQVSEETQRELPLTPDQRAVLQNIPGEFSPLRHEFGVLSMARWDNDPDSARMSFSILLGEAPHLDGKYTVFGHVEQGVEVLRAIQAVPHDGTTPSVRISISKMAVAENANDLAAVLKEAASAPKREVAALARPMSRNTLIGALIFIALVSIGVALAGRRLPDRAVYALHLGNLLIAAFALLVALGPQTAGSSWLGAALVLFLLGSFRLLGRFETL